MLGLRVLRIRKALEALLKHREQPRIVATRVAADMRHQDLHILHTKTIELAERIAHIAAIHIAIDRPCGFEFTKRLQHLHRADIARMPYLIHITKMLEDALIEIAVRITQKSYTSHNKKILENEMYEMYWGAKKMRLFHLEKR